MYFFWTISYQSASRLKQQALNIGFPNNYHQKLMKTSNNYVIKISQIH